MRPGPSTSVLNSLAIPILPDEPARPFSASDFRDSEGRLRRQAARFRIWRRAVRRKNSIRIPPDRCPYRELDSSVAVVQAADHGLGNDATKPLDLSAEGCILAERQVRANLVVVAGIRGHDPAKVRLARHDHVISAFASYRTDQTLHVGVLPGRPQLVDPGCPARAAVASRRGHRSRLDLAPDILALCPTETPRSSPSNPFGAWMRRYGVVNELPPAMSEKHQAVEQLEADRGHDEQVRGGNSRRMVAREGRPTLTRSSGALDHILGDCRFGDLDAEFEQLAMDLRRTHSQLARLISRIRSRSPWGSPGGHLWTATSGARRP
jgi:hypothetical protein